MSIPTLLPDIAAQLPSDFRTALLARQLNVDAFSRNFADNAPLDKQAVLAWPASPQGLAGVPHAQRSIAQV